MLKPSLTCSALKVLELTVRAWNFISLPVAYVIQKLKSMFAPSAVTVIGGPPSRLGFFHWNGKDFFRHDDRSIARVKLMEINSEIDPFGSETTTYKQQPVEEVDESCLSPGESTLRGIMSNACPSPLEKGEVLIYDTVFNLHSSGTVFENTLLLCRHKTRKLKEIVIKGSNVMSGKSGIKIELTRAYYLDKFGAPEWNEAKHTCTMLDLIAIPLHKDEISNIGVKSWKEKDLTRKYELQRGSITYSTDDFATIIKEEGAIPENSTRIHNLGLSLAKIHSKPGASASPVCVIQCGTKLAGLWLGVPSHSLAKFRDSYNLFMHSDALVANLDQMGLIHSPLLKAMKQWSYSLRASLEAQGWQLAEGNGCCPEGQTSPGESREDKRTRQARMWREYLEDLEEEQREKDDEYEDYEDQHDRLRSEYQEEEEARDKRLKHLNSKEFEELMHAKPVFAQLPSRSSGHARSNVLTPSFFKLSPTVAAPLHKKESENLEDQDFARCVRRVGENSIHLVLAFMALKHNRRIKLRRCWKEAPQSCCCEYFDIGESADKATVGAPPGLEDEFSPLEDVKQRYSLDTLVRSWKYRLLHEDAPAVLKEIEIFTQTEPPMPRAMGPEWIDEYQQHSYLMDASPKDVRKRLRAVLNVESNGRLRDYIQKTTPDWTPEEHLGKSLEDEVIYDKVGDPYFRKVGTFDKSFNTKAKKPKGDETPLQKAIRDLATKYHQTCLHECTKGEYRIPLGTKENIQKSLKAQAKLTTAAKPDLSEQERKDFEAAVKYVKGKYTKGTNGAKIRSYLEEGEKGFWKTFLGYEDKSSGISARYQNLKKSAWVRARPVEVVDLTLSRLILLAIAGKQIFELSAMELIDYGCADVKDAFIKPEVHSPNKLKDDRYRLIWISSLIDLTVQAMLHKADNAAYTDAFQSGNFTCAALGMGHSDDGIKHLVRAFKIEGVAESNVSCDASAFDLSIDSSFILADGERRRDNCIDPLVGQLVYQYAHVLSSHVLNNQGDAWLVVKYGVTTSGHLSTTTQNSFARSVQAAFGGAKGWTCAGDDLVADSGFDPKRLECLGVRSRDIASHENCADFTSHLIDIESATARFKNVEKMLWNLYHCCRDLTSNRERFGGLLYILRNTPGVREDLSELADTHKIDTEGHVEDNDSIRDLL